MSEVVEDVVISLFNEGVKTSSNKRTLPQQRTVSAKQARKR